MIKWHDVINAAIVLSKSSAIDAVQAAHCMHATPLSQRS